ncbi:hypothetical protein HanRHA438_Chr07g0311041 [Helianthus annuus]|uniref:Uncharacterized protein n=1 Tax=Helianthus annuus TaxID=4232 RepID=A0A251UCQ3_HELAN|nr:hypothetical protein HanRHA438_Chr07g0311041 [Helianthus annuus]
MANVKDMHLLQDGTPPGGFAPVCYARRIQCRYHIPRCFWLYLLGHVPGRQGNNICRYIFSDFRNPRFCLMFLLIEM